MTKNENNYLVFLQRIAYRQSKLLQDLSLTSEEESKVEE
jgi:hypothetical protein